MRALVKTAAAADQVHLVDDWAEPVAGPGWVVVEVLACGVCGTDLHIMAGQHRSFPPVVLGHEYVGRIVGVGPGVERWAVGDRVVCEQHTGACLRCDACRRGAIQLCREKRSPGWGIDGAFAERMALPASLLHRVPDEVSDLAAAVTEPTAICLTGLDRAGAVSGQRVAVLGPGPVGLLSALLAARSGAATVTVVGRSSSSQRLELAQRLGLGTLLSDRVDAVAAVLDGTEGEGVDLVLETSGSGSALSDAFRMTRRLGRVVCLGIGGHGSQPVDYDEAMTRSLSVHFSMSSEYSAWDRVLRLMARGLDPRPLVTCYALADWRAAFADVAARRVVKAMITPGTL